MVVKMNSGFTSTMSFNTDSCNDKYKRSFLNFVITEVQVFCNEDILRSD